MEARSCPGWFRETGNAETGFWGCAGRDSGTINPADRLRAGSGL